MEWIKIASKSPPRRRLILFYAYDEIQNGYCVRYGRYMDGEYESYETDGEARYKENEVTHWMLAPLPPEN